MIVVDASVTLSWAFADEASEYGDSVLLAVQRDGGFIVPAVWTYEVANGLAMGQTRGRVNPTHALQFYELLSALTINLDSDSVAVRSIVEGTASAVKYGLTAYDAAYVELAIRKAAVLATMDRAMKRVAQRVGVPIFEVEA